MAFQQLKRELVHPLPKLYETEHHKDPTVYAHFFCPANGWHWYVTEGQEEEGDLLMFGLVKGFETELGYISFNELEATRAVLVDLSWTPKPLSEVRRSA